MKVGIRPVVFRTDSEIADKVAVFPRIPWGISVGHWGRLNRFYSISSALAANGQLLEKTINVLLSITKAVV